nr:LCP family protein [Bifidobacterium sp. DSM 109963]
MVAILAFAGTAAGATLLDINGAIANGAIGVIAQKGQSDQTQIIDPNAGKPIEFVVIGQDTREGASNAAVGGDGAELEANHNADTTIVVQIAADRKYVSMMSIPRDSLVSVPSCNTSRGTMSAQYNVMFNSIFANAYQLGGDLSSAASCTVNAVNSLTGLDIQNFIVVDFGGLQSMIDAIGGVELCIPADVQDAYSGIDLTKGRHQLDGMTATQYARMRYGAGDGSDVQRTTRQQYLIKQLFRQALNKDLLTQSGQLYQLAKAALKSFNISKGLANTSTLAGLAMSLKDLDVSHLYARTVPVTQSPSDPNRVVWTSDADDLWAKMRSGEPIVDQSESSVSTQDGQQDSQSSSDESTDQSTTDISDGTKVADGVLKDGTGQYIDEASGGIIDEETGIISDPTTHQTMGISEQYLNNVACPVN